MKKAARRLYEESGGSIDLLLTDLVMPGENGSDLAKHLSRKNPEMSVILMSGYPDRVNLGDDPFVARTEFLAKPYDVDSLVDRVRDALQEQVA